MYRDEVIQEDTPMDAERHARVKELFFRAIELEEAERSRFLEDACGSDAALRAELESLLTHFLRSDLPEDFS